MNNTNTSTGWNDSDPISSVVNSIHWILNKKQCLFMIQIGDIIAYSDSIEEAHAEMNKLGGWNSYIFR